MEEFLLTPRDKQEARIGLLRHYSLQCVAHSVYIVTITVGFLGLVEFGRSMAFPLFASELSRDILFSFMYSGFLVLVVYALGRTFFWIYLRAAIINVKPKKESEVKRESEKTTVTFMEQLHVACFEYVKERHRTCARVFALRPEHLALIWFDVFVAFLVIFLTL